MSAADPRPEPSQPKLTVIAPEQLIVAQKIGPALTVVPSKHGNGPGLLAGVLLGMVVLGGVALVMLVLLAMSAWYVLVPRGGENKVVQANSKQPTVTANPAAKLPSVPDAVEPSSAATPDTSEPVRVEPSEEKSSETIPDPPAEAERPAASPLDMLLERLSAAKSIDALPFLKDLATTSPVPERRDDVAAVLDYHLLEGNDDMRLAAMRAIRAWKTAGNVPALRTLMESKNPQVGSEAMQTMQDLGLASEVAAVWAERLASPSQRPRALAGLVAMGPMAEEFVWRHLGANSDLLHDAACDVLAKIGTEKSLKRLKPLLANSPSAQVNHLQNAISIIERRVTLAADQAEMKDMTRAERIAKFIERAQAKDETAAGLQKTLRYLDGVEPIPAYRDQVANLLDELLRSEKQGFSILARLHMGKWGTKDNLPTLIKLLETCKPIDRRVLLQIFEAIGGPEGAVAIPLFQTFLDEKQASSDHGPVLAALGSIPVPEAAEALGKQLSRNGFDAVRALQKMGPVAEDAILPYLDSTEQAVFDAACKVLGKIGTEKSRKELTSHRTTSNGSLDFSVRLALDELERRLGKPK